MMDRRAPRWAFDSLILFFVLMTPGIALSEVEKLLAQVNSKPAEERQRLLVENAKREGSVTFYAGTNFRDTQEIVAAFNKHYPFIRRPRSRL